MSARPSSLRLRTPFLNHLFFATLAIYLNAGSFKQDPRLAWLPIDLTLLMASMLLFWVLAAWLGSNRDTSGSSILATLALYTLLVPGLLNAPLHSYAREKCLFLMTLTPLAFMGGLVAGNRSGSFRQLLGWMLALSLLITGDGLIKVMTSHDLLRVSGFGGNTIALGRAAGLAFLLLALRFLIQSDPWWQQVSRLSLSLVAAVVVLFSGSRGPLLSALIAMSVVLFTAKNKGVWPKFLLLVALGAVVMFSTLAMVPTRSLSRMASFFSGDFGGSEMTRWYAAEKALPLISTHPFGIGWGGFVGLLRALADQGPRQYPHNILMEMLLEGGWLSGLGACIMLKASWSRVTRLAIPRDREIWVGLMLFFVINALVSGDLNDNRDFFFWLGLGLGWSLLLRNDVEGMPIESS